MVQVTSRSILVQDTTQCTWFRILHSAHGLGFYTVHMVQYILGSTWFKLLRGT
jgi:hypothetical protein